MLPRGLKNIPTISGNQLAWELESWEAPTQTGTLLQCADDLLIATETEKECVQWTVELLNFLGLNGYWLSKSKAQLIRTRVFYLGYEITGGQRGLGAARKEAICRTPWPSTVKDLQMFLGMTGWCRLWIHDYGVLETPTKPLAAIETIYSSRPDLKEEPLEGADSWYTDGSNFVKDGKRRTGYAITTTSEVTDPLTPQHKRQK